MRSVLIILAILAVVPVHAQESKAWLESQGLEAAANKEFQEYEAVVARVKGAKDSLAAQERIVLFRQGKVAWQTNPKELVEPAARFTLHSLGRDINGDGQPDLHFSVYTGGAHCCTAHYVYVVKPQVRRLAFHNTMNAGGSDFIDIPGRKTPVMISADDSSAYVFAPYSDSYFPAVVLEVNSAGRFRLVPDLMRPKLPGMPPPICAQPAATANAWLKGRCAEFSGTKAKARTAEIQAKLRGVKSERSGDKAKWEDYFASGVLAAVAAELNRYAYTGHAGAGLNWLEGVWPGNDAIKLAFLGKLRETRTKSAFVEDLRALGADSR